MAGPPGGSPKGRGKGKEKGQEKGKGQGKRVQFEGLEADHESTYWGPVTGIFSAEDRTRVFELTGCSVAIRMRPGWAPGQHITIAGSKAMHQTAMWLTLDSLERSKGSEEWRRRLAENEAKGKAKGDHTRRRQMGERLLQSFPGGVVAGPDSSGGMAGPAPEANEEGEPAPEASVSEEEALVAGPEGSEWDASSVVSWSMPSTASEEVWYDFETDGGEAFEDFLREPRAASSSSGVAGPTRWADEDEWQD